MSKDGPYPDPSFPKRADVVVIGGGVNGALVTLQLAERGFSVVCLEAHTKNFGSSQRSAAAARQQFGTSANIAMQIYAVKGFFLQHRKCLGPNPPMHHAGYHFLYDGYVRESGKEPRLDPEAVRNAIRKRVELQVANGLTDVTMLMPEDISKLFPYIDTTNIACSTYCPTDGYCFPDVITNDGFERAESLGASLFQNTPVTDLVYDGSRVTGVKCSKGVIACDFVVNAAGIWAPKIAKMVGTDLPIHPVKRYLYFMEPQVGSASYEQFAQANNMPVNLDRMPFTIVPGGAYVRSDNRSFMLGWDHRPAESALFHIPDILDRDEATRYQDCLEPGFGLHDNPTYGDDMCGHEAQYLPFLMDACGYKTATAGFYEITKDHLPIIDRDPKAPNLIHCAGFSGHGVMQAPAAGRLVAEIISDETTFVDPYAYSLAGLARNINGESGGRPHETMVI
jgi:sarcosine oxidase, subunit beta